MSEHDFTMCTDDDILKSMVDNCFYHNAHILPFMTDSSFKPQALTASAGSGEVPYETASVEVHQLNTLQYMWQSVILLAFKDAISKSSSPTAKSYKKRALYWLLECTEDFYEVCEHAGFDPRAIRERARVILGQSAGPSGADRMRGPEARNLSSDRIEKSISLRFSEPYSAERLVKRHHKNRNTPH